MGVFSKYAVYTTEGSDGAPINKRADDIYVELALLDWSDANSLYIYFENNLLDLIYYFDTDERIKPYAYRPEPYVIIPMVLKQHPGLQLPENRIRMLNNRMYEFSQSNPKIDQMKFANALLGMLEISKIINKRIYKKLEYINCTDITLNGLLPVSRYSNLDPRVNVERVNHVLMKHMDPRETCEEDLMDIYGELFYDDFEEFFVLSMLQSDLNIIGEDMNWMFDLETNAILFMLNERPMSIIKRCLVKYTEECLKQQKTRPGVRCSILALSADYDKIVYIAEELKAQGYYVI